ncbi:hypothetical protein LguiA_010995 [Lonicera macranthoides]
MPTLFSPNTLIPPIVVPPPLPHPRGGSLRGPPPTATPPKNVLPVRPVRVLQFAISPPLSCIPLCVPG